MGILDHVHRWWLGWWFFIFKFWRFRKDEIVGKKANEDRRINEGREKEGEKQILILKPEAEVLSTKLTFSQTISLPWRGKTWRMSNSLSSIYYVG